MPLVEEATTAPAGPTQRRILRVPTSERGGLDGRDLPASWAARVGRYTDYNHYAYDEVDEDEDEQELEQEQDVQVDENGEDDADGDGSSIGMGRRGGLDDRRLRQRPGAASIHLAPPRSNLSDALDMFSRSREARFADYIEEASRSDLYERLGAVGVPRGEIRRAPPLGTPPAVPGSRTGSGSRSGSRSGPQPEPEPESPSALGDADSRETIMLILRNYNRYGPSLEALHSAERAAHDRDRTESIDYGRVPSLPVRATSWLVPGARFTGRRELSFTPSLDAGSNRVNDETVNFEVIVEDVNLDNLTLALSVRRSPTYLSTSTISTTRSGGPEPEKWECELVDHRRNTLRVTSLRTDLIGWRRLRPFADMKTGDYYKSVHSPHFLERLQEQYVLMRWFHARTGGHCLVVMRRDTGAIEGVSYELAEGRDKNEPRYRLSLAPASPLYALPSLRWA